MNGFWIPSVRAAMLFVIVIIALLAFAADKIAPANSAASGKDLDWTVAADANPDTPKFAVFAPGRQEVKMWRNSALDDRGAGTWLLMIFGLGAVAFSLRCRRSDRDRYQFA